MRFWQQQLHDRADPNNAGNGPLKKKKQKRRETEEKTSNMSKTTFPYFPNQTNCTTQWCNHTLLSVFLSWRVPTGTMGAQDGGIYLGLWHEVGHKLQRCLRTSEAGGKGTSTELRAANPKSLVLMPCVNRGRWGGVSLTGNCVLLKGGWRGRLIPRWFAPSDFFFMVMGNNIMTSVNHFQPRRCSAGAKRTGLGPNKMVTLNDNGNFECSDEQTKRREDVHTSRDIEGVFSANGKRLAERSWGQLRKQSKRSCCTNTTRNQNYTTTAFIPQKCPQDGLKLNKNWSSAA